MRYRILWVVFLHLSLVCVGTSAASGPPNFSNLTIVVSSCDKYAELWHPFFTFLFKSWPSLLTDNAHVPIILITSQKNYQDPHGRVIVHQTGQDSNWSTGMATVLKEVKTDYVLYLQDDYIIHHPVNEPRLHELLTVIQENENLGYLQIGPDGTVFDDPRFTQIPGVVNKKRYWESRITLLAALWRKDIFAWLIKEQEDPWQFEVRASKRSQGMMKDFWAVAYDHPIVYLNACNLGYWDHDVLDYIQAAGVEIARKLPIDNEHLFLRWVQVLSPKSYKRLMVVKSWFS